MAEASIFSAAFVFTEYRSMNVTDKDESTWTPVTIEIAPPRREPPPLAGKYVYAFRKLGNDVKLVMEYRAKSDGKLSVRDGLERRTFERDDPAVTLVETGTDQTSLPHTINGRKALYFFIVTRIRLAADAIRQLESEPPPALPWLDLEKRDTFVITGAEAEGQSVVGRIFLGVIDPYTVALTLHREYEQACNELLNFTMEFKEQSAEARDLVQGRQKTLILARLLKNVLEQDAADKLGLRDEFADGSGASVTRFIADFEDRTKNLELERDRRCIRLCLYLRSKLITSTESLHLFFEEKDYNVVLDVMGAALERLNECPPGRSFLGAMLDQNPHLLKTYVLPMAAMGEPHFQVGRKSAVAIINIWNEVLPGLIMKKGPEAPVLMVKAIEYVTRETLVHTRRVVEAVSYRSATGFKRVTITFDTLHVIQETEVRVHLERWAAAPAGGGSSHSAAVKVAELLFCGVEAANVMFSLKALAAADGADQAKAVANVLGSTLDAVTAFNVLLKLPNKSIKVVGMISGGIDAVLAYYDAKDAYSRDDFSNMAGMGLVSLGSGLATIGCFCAVFGLGTGVTGFGLPLAIILEALGAILVTVGWVISAFTADSEIELFVSHCKFGKSFGSRRDAKPKWTVGAFSEWTQGNDGLDKQIRTLFNILAAFSLEAADYTTVRIRPGLLTGDSKFEVNFETRYHPGKVHQPRLLVDVGSRTMTQAGGDPADLSKVRFIEDSAGRITIEVNGTLPPDQSTLGRSFCRCDVRLQLGGQQPTTVPISGAVVPMVILPGEWGLSSDKVSSKEF